MSPAGAGDRPRCVVVGVRTLEPCAEWPHSNSVLFLRSGGRRDSVVVSNGTVRLALKLSVTLDELTGLEKYLVLKPARLTSLLHERG